MCKTEDKYGGKVPSKWRKAKTASLYWIRNSKGSQWSSVRMGVICLCFLILVMRRAEQFWTLWRQFVWSEVIPVICLIKRNEFWEMNFHKWILWQNHFENKKQCRLQVLRNHCAKNNNTCEMTVLRKKKKKKKARTVICSGHCKKYARGKFNLFSFQLYKHFTKINIPL